MHARFWISAAMLLAVTSVSSMALPLPQVTSPAKRAPGEIILVKREQAALGKSVWTSTGANGIKEIVTATTIDGVTISASPAQTTDSAKATPWNSLDGSGIPIMVTPSIVTPGPGGSTISASPTIPASLSNYPTPGAIPPVLRCFGDRVPGDNSKNSNLAPGYPFCSPLNGTEWIVGETYWVTWDPTYWGGSDITQVKIFARYLPINDNEDRVFITDWISNADGYFPLTILSDYKVEGTGGYMFIDMTPLVSTGSDADHTGTVSGPIIRVIKAKSEAQTTISRLPSDNRRNSISGSTSSSNFGLTKGQLAVAILIPILVVFIVAAFSYYWFALRRRAANDANIRAATAGKGVAIPKGQALNALATTRTGESQQTMSNPFHDNNAVELDDRPVKASSAI